jgi:hypothetical protein
LLDQLRVWATSQRWFWSLRVHLKRLKFQIESKVHQGRSGVTKATTNARILADIAWVAFRSLIKVVVVVGLLIFIEGYLLENKIFLEPLTDEEKKYNIEQIRLYAQVLTGIFSIYFATIGIIVSASYTRFRTDIIQLLTNEQVGSVYSHLLVTSAAFCLISASLPFVGIYPNLLMGAASMTLTLASSLALFPLGQRLFNFFDVSLLMRIEIIPRIARHIASAANPSSSSSLANHHSKAARIGLDQLSYIDDRLLANKEGLASTIPAITDAYSSLLLHYMKQKHKIDHTSYWFPRAIRHKRWFFSNDTETSMALQTGSQLRMDEKPDANWFEALITKRLLGHIERAFEVGEYELAHSLIARFSHRTAVYAQDLRVVQGMDELAQIKSLIVASFASKPAKLSVETKKNWLAIADTWTTIGSNLCLETLRRMRVLERELEQFFLRDVWTQNSLRTLPLFLQADLNFIVDRIKFEEKIEGQRLSQKKYVQQLAIQKLLQHYAEVLPIVCDFFDKTLQEFVQSLQDLGHKEAATQVVLGSLHSYWKLPRWFEDISQLLERYRVYAHHSEKPYVLPSIDVTIFQKRLKLVHDLSMAKLADPALVGHIFTVKEDDELPDHFGQIYFGLVDAAIATLAGNDPEQFGKILPTVISLCVLASDMKFPSSELDLTEEYRLHLVSSAIVDLASVLGFAILYGTYFDNPALQKIATDHFQELLERAEDKVQYLKRMLLLSNIGAVSMKLSPRDAIRTRWKLEFERQVRDDGYSSRRSFGRGNVHPNPMISRFLDSGSDAQHLFFVTQVLPIIQPIDYDINYQITALARMLRDDEVVAVQ